MNTENYLKDISEIKSIMNKSTKFLSLSGLSGILVGIYALIGAYVAYEMISEYSAEIGKTRFNYVSILRIKLILVAFCVLAVSIATGFVLTYRKAKTNNESIWNGLTRKLLVDFCVPLFTGGLVCLILMSKGYYGVIAPATLIFYGLSLYSASKYTVGSIKYLGLAEIILGLISFNYIGYGITFWAIGFGIFHIIYGIIFYYKHDRN
ncbi:hypothetical protein [Aureivirga sp. CE67]|uniref:hypothetical protein n=1 Tax=Aureivirga sp. CE67 TaxID=1788983 RepID=UPI0018CB2BA5|nr:hypothetical protein [Aureivirga sp. CE67]